jgi:hypothetical protein
MAIDRQVSPFPGPGSAAPVDIELVPPEEELSEVFFDQDGSAIVGFNPEEEYNVPFGDNIAEVLDDSVLAQVSSELRKNYEDDLRSRDDWFTTFSKGLELLGIKTEDRSEPFAGSSGVFHPLLAEAVTQFQSQTYKELLPPGGPVDTQVMGKTTDPKIQQANRVKNFMNYQITYKMQEYDPEMDQLLFYLPLSGSAFKKIYFDPAVGRVVARFIKSEDLVVPYYAVDLLTSPRITHVIHMTDNDLRKLQLSGFYRDVDMAPPSNIQQTEVEAKIDELEGKSRTLNDEEYTLLEVHVELDLEGFEDHDPEGEPTGLALPYIVTICLDTNQVLSIRQNYVQTDPMRKKIEYFSHYKFLPGLGFYGFGLIHMIGGVTRSVTALLRQLIDAGTLSNLPAGFKSRGLNIQRTDDPLQPGEWRDVDSASGNLRDSFLPLPYKEPSGTLANLLGTLVESGQRFASVMDQNIGDGNQSAPVGTTVALLEKGLKVISAIHKRLHYAQRIEFKILKRVFGESLPPVYPYQVQGGEENVFQEDFGNDVDVIPVSDPNIFSSTQRIILAQTQLQLAQSAPELHNMKEAYRKMYLALNIRDIDEILLPDQPPPIPKDPIQENQDALMKAPLKAFMPQNHDAHIDAHVAFTQNPSVSENQEAVGALNAHIQEHEALKYRIQVEQILTQQGVQLPQPGPDGQLPQLPPEAESQIAMAAAQATQEITGQEQALAAAMENPDPQRQMFEEQMRLEREQLEQKEVSSQRDAEIKREKIESDERREDLRTAADLQEAEMKHQEEVDKSLIDLTKIAREAREE